MMPNGLRILIGKVRAIENTYSKDSYDGLRIRAEVYGDNPKKVDSIPWAFPLLPKTFQSIPKVGEAVLVLTEDTQDGQRWYLGPIISQPQYQVYCPKETATSLLNEHTTKPIEKISNLDDTRGAFPTSDSVAMVGRGAEDVSLTYDSASRESAVTLRAGVRGEPTNSSNKNMIGNIIFNGTDPAYIQLKYKNGISTGSNKEGNSLINIVANRINIMSNRDSNIADKLQDKDSMIANDKVNEVMDKLHQVPLGDVLLKYLEIVKGAILEHVHPWAGMSQCGDWAGYIRQLESFDPSTILSKYVRIS